MLEEKIIETLFKLAKKSEKNGDFPVSALITCNNKIISTAYNKREKTHNTIDHAEIIAIKKANKKLKTWRLSDCELYVTLEPCEMCKNVIKEARIKTTYYYLEKSPHKQQYSKSNFIKVNYMKKNQIIAEYIKKISLFFLDKR